MERRHRESDTPLAQLRVNKLRRITRVTVGRGPTTMGRSSENAVVLPHTSVSREHCLIELVEGEPRLRDLGSRHGTKLNGRRTDVATLHDGDRIGVGPFEIIYCDPKRAARPGGQAAPGAAESAAAVDEEREALRQRVEALERQEDELATQRRALEAREQAIAERSTELYRLHSEMEGQRAEREESLGVLRAEIDSLQSLLSERQRQLEESAERTGAEERRARELEAELTEAQQQQATLEDQLEQAGKRLDEQTERARKELEARSQRLEEAIELGASLRDRIKQLEESQEDAARRTEHAEQSLQRLEQTIKQLSQVSERLTAAHGNLRNLETIWTETSEWLEQTDKRDLPALRHIAQQRDMVGEQLEAALADRDALLAEVQEQIERLGELTDEERREWETIVRRTQTRSFLSGLTRRFAT